QCSVIIRKSVSHCIVKRILLYFRRNQSPTLQLAHYSVAVVFSAVVVLHYQKPLTNDKILSENSSKLAYGK
ncbi:hypothetical protein, partial [uncultured Croceitalea sp.]|uniref:hypothetical protein n=1 Tax=uncultured Croceitalea sp. TaxID=1798908 RepID=UPI00330587BE